MSEQDLNNETYEMPSNDMNTPSNDTKLVGSGSTLAETITAAGGVDPSRLWVVVMIGLFIAVAAIVIFGGGYLIDQGKNKDKEITQLKQELKECPQRTLEDFKKQQEAIDALKSEALYDRQRIQEIKEEKIKDLERLKKIDNKLNNEVK